MLRLFIDRTLFLDCLLIDPESCYSALRGEDLPYVEESPSQVSKGKKRDGRRYKRALNNDQLYMYRLSQYDKQSGEVISVLSREGQL